jgi:hypothetical protein
MNDQNSAKMNQKVAEFSMSSATFQRLTFASGRIACFGKLTRTTAIHIGPSHWSAWIQHEGLAGFGAFAFTV